MHWSSQHALGNLVEFRSQVLVTDVWPAFKVLMAIFCCLFLRYKTNYITYKSLKFFCHEKDLNFIEISPPPHSNMSTSFPIAMFVFIFLRLCECQVFYRGERFRDSSACLMFCVCFSKLQLQNPVPIFPSLIALPCNKSKVYPVFFWSQVLVQSSASIVAYDYLLCCATFGVVHSVLFGNVNWWLKQVPHYWGQCLPMSIFS